MAASSSSAAVSVGTGMPSLARWLIVREVPKPSAPASIASPASRAISAQSPASAASRATARCPIAKTRSAACGIWVAMSQS